MTPNIRDRQDPPFCIKLEFTRGCNLQCDFCGINSIQDRPSENLKFMSRETAKAVIANIPRSWNSRFEMSLRGEPSLNPDGPYIVSLLRERFPKSSIMMTSNGGGFVGRNGFKHLMDLYDAGVNIIALDDYAHANLVPKIRRYTDDLELEGVRIYEYPEQKEGNPHKRRKGKHLVFIQDITEATKGTHSTLSNHAGSAAPLDYKYKDKRCGLPFRELVIRYDGTVNLCCHVWTGQFTYGDLSLESAEEIWHGKPIEAMRKILYHEGRVESPCLGCTAKPLKVGLLPDKLGKLSMPPVSLKDRQLVRSMSFAGWEKGIKGRALENIPVVQVDGEEDDL